MKENEFTFLDKESLEKKLNESIQNFIRIITDIGPSEDMYFDCGDKVWFQDNPAMFFWDIKCYALIPEHKAIIDELFPQFYGITSGGPDCEFIHLYWNVIE